MTILSIDQGTTSSRAVIYSEQGQPLHTAQEEFAQIYPQDGWVEHDPNAIWTSVLNTCQAVIKKHNPPIQAIGITNQRETTLVWNKHTGECIYNAIVWQDRRTASTCKQLRDTISPQAIQEKTGLLLDPYFSASKIAWILDHINGARAQAENGDLLFGTVDTFLIWKLTKGQVHATDATNASRTLLFNIHTQDWDDELLNLFNVPRAMLPTVKDCADDYGVASADFMGADIPICGVAGDQQSALIGQGCLKKGMIKSTYGTGAFVVLNTGKKPVYSSHNLLSTIAYRINGTPQYALEGSIFVAGAGVQWLRDGVGLIDSAKASEALAKQSEQDKPEHNLYLVPAFTGLGAPHWNPDARGALYGITRNTTPADIARATLESVCYQTHDLITAMCKDGAKIRNLRVDGGMVENDWLLQCLANTLDIKVTRPVVNETTSLGVAYLAALGCGLYDDLTTIKDHWQGDKKFKPQLDEHVREAKLNGWALAIKRTTL